MLLLALAATPLPGACKPQLAPLTTGTTSGPSNIRFWRKSEAGEWYGEGWLGWTFATDALQPVRMTVRDRPKNREQDEDEVSVESTPDVTFAVRCIPQVRAGKIQQAGVVNESVGPRRPVNISVGRRVYQVRIQTSRDDLFDAKVMLVEGRRMQVLYSVPGFADDPHFEIVWAGDLDGDGKLDLLVDLEAKYSVHPYRLLLSSKAVGRELVGDAALFETRD